jgi:hypothetical protein
MAGYTAAIPTASMTSTPGTASGSANLLVTHAQAAKVEIAVDRLDAPLSPAVLSSGARWSC